ncbi:MAG: glycosyltransferase [Elusimicrobia bacterium]|nr:glycosyltransferase [Elusimicrobiota bacterium]
MIGRLIFRFSFEAAVRVSNFFNRPIIHVTDCHEMTGGVHQISLLMQGIHRAIGVSQILVCRPGGTVGRRFRELGFEVREISMFQDYDLLAAAKLAGLIMRVKPWLVHAHHSTAHAVALAARFFLRFPLVVSRRVTHPIPWYPTSRWKYASSKINLLICVSQAVRQELEKSGVEPSRLVVIGSSTDLRRFIPKKPSEKLLQELNISPGVKVLALIANCAPWKGQDFFLEVLARLAHIPLMLLLAGRDTDSSAIRQKIVNLALDGRVTPLGWRSDVEDILSASDALVCPSSAGEGSSGAIREAFAMGVPVIASDIAANRELVNGGRGWLFRSQDVQDGVRAIEQFFKETEVSRRARIERSRQFVTANFSTDAMVRQTLEAYQRVA